MHFLSSLAAVSALAAAVVAAPTNGTEPSEQGPLVARTSSSLDEFDGLVLTLANPNATRTQIALKVPDPSLQAGGADPFILDGKYPNQQVLFLLGPNGNVAQGFQINSDGNPLTAAADHGSTGFWAPKITGNETQQLQFEGPAVSGFYACASSGSDAQLFYTKNGSAVHAGPCAPVTLEARIL